MQTRLSPKNDIILNLQKIEQRSKYESSTKYKPYHLRSSTEKQKNENAQTGKLKP
jgi:hypothetical protein